MNKEKLQTLYNENKRYQKQIEPMINNLSEQTSGIFIKRNITDMIL